MPHSGKLSVVELVAHYEAGSEKAVSKCLNGSDALVVFPAGGREASITWTPHKQARPMVATPSSDEMEIATLAVAPDLPEGAVIAPLVLDERKKTCTIGRGWACGIKLKSSDVSRAHARFCLDESGLWSLEDLGSNNGTFVDGVKLVPHQPVVVHPYREIRFADVRTMFLDHEAVIDVCRSMIH